MEQIICLNEGCCNTVKQTTKYTKRKYCSLECTKEANNKKHQELRKTERKLGLVKKKYVGGRFKMPYCNEDVDNGYVFGLARELNAINRIENKNFKIESVIKKENIAIQYNKPKQSIKKKQKQLFDYIFDKWIFYKPIQHKIKKITTISTMQLCLF